MNKLQELLKRVDEAIFSIDPASIMKSAKSVDDFISLMDALKKQDKELADKIVNAAYTAIGAGKNNIANEVKKLLKSK